MHRDGSLGQSVVSAGDILSRLEVDRAVSLILCPVIGQPSVIHAFIREAQQGQVPRFKGGGILPQLQKIPLAAHHQQAGSAPGHPRKGEAHVLLQAGTDGSNARDAGQLL